MVFAIRNNHVRWISSWIPIFPPYPTEARTHFLTQAKRAVKSLHQQCGWKTKYDGEKLPLAAYNFIFWYVISI
jgi:hypothetical protein